MTFVESLKRYRCGTHFSSKQSPNGNSAFTAESQISLPIRFHIWFNFDAAVTWQSHVTPRGSGWKFPDLRTSSSKCFKRLTSREFRGESSGDLETRGRLRFEVRFESFLRLTCRVFRKDRRGEALETARGEKIRTVSRARVAPAVGYGFLS
ncbi:hypothetical protein H5410_005307 [Solanum commersonii]|uniref:Uncharacterized protein n=1 Tax=Solanum commersonii TaxID=4109 RepID=A0A9J6A6B8_SOLCO|nr:hypothetical protein H5410_005307 [Solanum commersonii]